MLNVQSTAPEPVPVESCSAVISAVCRAPIVSAGTKPELADQTAEFSVTPIECTSLRSTSAKFKAPVGSGLVVSSDVDPVTPGCSASEAEPGPLVIATASFAPVMTTDTTCVELVAASLTLIL
jgi:hypothetical protein